MELYENGPRFVFNDRETADSFCTVLRQDGFKYDVVTIIDVFNKSGNALPVELLKDGFHYGYSRKEIKKFKPERDGNRWIVRMPVPGRMIRDRNGYWTTNPEDPMDIPTMSDRQILEKCINQLAKFVKGG